MGILEGSFFLGIIGISEGYLWNPQSELSKVFATSRNLCFGTPGGGPLEWEHPDLLFILL